MDAIKEGMLASAKAAEAAARIGERLFRQNTQSVMNFKSQICTDKNQSERLLSLGLKKETADCCYLWHWESDSHTLYAASWEGLHRTTSDIPAWSLHRLAEMLASKWGEIMLFLPDTYDEIISDIEIEIGRENFNKEYLV